jgi:microcystin-dependent protein
MINKRFNQLGNIKKLRTTNNESYVQALNEINDSMIKTGTIIWYAGPVTPEGWMNCDGSVVLVADYPELYAAIGNKYSLTTDTFDDTVQFRLPTGTARAIVGYDANNVNFNALGKRGGTNSVALEEAFLCGKQHEFISLVAEKKDFPYGPRRFHEYDYTSNYVFSWTPTSNEQRHYWSASDQVYYYYNGYNYYTLYSTNNSSMRVQNYVGFARMFNTTEDSTNDGLVEHEEIHNNIQPYNTLRMIIKVDKKL